MVLKRAVIICKAWLGKCCCYKNSRSADKHFQLPSSGLVLVQVSISRNKQIEVATSKILLFHCPIGEHFWSYTYSDSAIYTHEYVEIRNFNSVYILHYDLFFLELCELNNINPLSTKHRLRNLKTQFVPCCKHFSARL